MGGAGRTAVAGVGDARALERERVLRYCARFTGDPHAAEDLAQQTLLEAWRHEAALRDPAKREAWLLGIARNRCLTWARTRDRERTRLLLPGSSPEANDVPAAVPDDLDLELELERAELAALLDRALALLPAATRAALVGRYDEELPQREIAARLGLTEGAVEARLHRGKLALRRLLGGELREEAAAFGLAAPGPAGWVETRIWCTGCGRHRLLGRFGEDGELQLDCPGCEGHGRIFMRSGASRYTSGIEPAEMFAGITGYGAALRRASAAHHAFYRNGITGLATRCHRCGGEARLRRGAEALFGGGHVEMACPRCELADAIGSVHWLGLAEPRGARFWREHRRIRTLPEREIEASGGPATVCTFESVAGSARLTVVLSRDTLEVLAVHGASGE